MPPALEQISISLSLERNSVAPATSVSARRCDSESEALLKDVLSKSEKPWALDLPERFPPFHMCISSHFADRVRQTHKLLSKALIDIVERWHSDNEAGFPSRMPLETHEEELLQWIDGPEGKYFRPFHKANGIWRTDFLIERANDGLERVRICEINARLPYNGTWVVGRLSEATRTLNSCFGDFCPSDDFKKTKEAIFDLYNNTKPLYNLREKWPGVDSPFFLDEWAIDSGLKTFTIKPSQLRSRKDPSAATGRSLYCIPEDDISSVNGVNGMDNARSGHVDSIPDTISQCSVELLQEELRAIDADTLHQLATCCTNDFRDSLLIHDKRLLCILRQQLPNLVARGILTEDERTFLEEATIETIIPGSPAMADLLKLSKNDDNLRKNYIVKPVRDGNAVGIRLGRKITQEEWLEKLEHLASRPLRPTEGACVVQRLVDHVWYDIATHYDSAKEVQQCHAIGSYHMIGPEVGVFGPWRLGKEINLGVQEGQSVVMCTVMRPEGWKSDTSGKEME